MQRTWDQVFNGKATLLVAASCQEVALIWQRGLPEASVTKRSSSALAIIALLTMEVVGLTQTEIVKRPVLVAFTGLEQNKNKISTARTVTKSEIRNQFKNTNFQNFKQFF